MMNFPIASTPHDIESPYKHIDLQEFHRRKACRERKQLARKIPAVPQKTKTESSPSYGEGSDLTMAE
jgi:hypothetical protein